MPVTRVGIQRPDDLPRNAEPTHSFTQGAIEYALYQPIDKIGVLIGTCHEDVGLVTWWRADSYDDASGWIAMQDE